MESVWHRWSRNHRAAAPIHRAAAPFALDAERHSRVRNAAAECFLVSTELCCHVRVKDKKKKNGFGTGRVVDITIYTCDTVAKALCQHVTRVQDVVELDSRHTLLDYSW